MSAILRNIKTLPKIRHEEASTLYFKNSAHFSRNPCQSFIVNFFSVSLHIKRNHERRQAICAFFFTAINQNTKMYFSVTS